IFDVSNAAMLNRLTGLLTEPVGSRPEQGVPPRAHKGSPLDGTTTIPRKQYDEFQLAAIEAATPALIVAGPGSGKTSTLIGRAEYLIHKLDVQPEHILALTFSRKAAQEMQHRLQLVLHAHDRADGAIPGGMPAGNTCPVFCGA